MFRRAYSTLSKKIKSCIHIFEENGKTVVDVKLFHEPCYSKQITLMDTYFGNKEDVNSLWKQKIQDVIRNEKKDSNVIIRISGKTVEFVKG